MFCSLAFVTLQLNSVSFCSPTICRYRQVRNSSLVHMYLGGSKNLHFLPCLHSVRERLLRRLHVSKVDPHIVSSFSPLEKHRWPWVNGITLCVGLIGMVRSKFTIAIQSCYMPTRVKIQNSPSSPPSGQKEIRILAHHVHT